MIRALLVLLSLTTIYFGSRVILLTESVEVVGNSHFTAKQIKKAAKLEVGKPWLWAWNFDLNDLRNDPWIISAKLEKPEMRKLSVVIKERKSIANIQRANSIYGISQDGLLLPNAPTMKPLLVGEAQENMTEVLSLIKLFPGVNEIHFGTSGYRVKTADLNIWAATVPELQRLAKAKTIKSSPKKGDTDTRNISAYPWGVSLDR